MTQNSPLQAVIFDWAGTMVDHGSRAPAGVFVDAFAKHGMTATMAQARGPMGVHKRAHVAAMFELPAIAEQWHKVSGRAPTDADIDAVYADVTQLQIACLPRFADPIPGALRTAETLRSRGIRVGSTTGYVKEMLDVLRPAAAEKGYTPDCAVSASEVPAARPAPFMLFEAMARLGVDDVRRCVAVGDTLPDVLAGRNAGMWTVGLALTGNATGVTAEELETWSAADIDTVRRDFGGVLRAHGAHFVVDGSAQLMPVIDEIEARIARGQTP